METVCLCLWYGKEGGTIIKKNQEGDTDFEKNRIPQKLAQTSYSQDGFEHGLVSDL